MPKSFWKYKQYVSLSPENTIFDVFIYYYNVAIMNLKDYNIKSTKTSCNVF